MATPSIDTSFSWFCEHKREKGIVRYEGDVSGLDTRVHVPFSDVLKAYKEVGHKMVAVWSETDSIRYAFNVARMTSFFENRHAIGTPVTGMTVTTGISLANRMMLGVGVAGLEMQELIRQFLALGYGKNWLQLEMATSQGSELIAVNFGEHPVYMAGPRGGTMLPSGYPSNGAPFIYPQAPYQIRESLETGEPFRVVRLPAPVSRESAPA